MLQWQVCLQSQPNGIIILIWLIDLAAHHIRIASQIYNIQREYYGDNELSMMQYLIELVVSFQTMDGRNDKANNWYGLTA